MALKRLQACDVLIVLIWNIASRKWCLAIARRRSKYQITINKKVLHISLNILVRSLGRQTLNTCRVEVLVSVDSNYDWLRLFFNIHLGVIATLNNQAIFAMPALPVCKGFIQANKESNNISTKWTLQLYDVKYVEFRHMQSWKFLHVITQSMHPFLLIGQISTANQTPELSLLFCVSLGECRIHGTPGDTRNTD